MLELLRKGAQTWVAKGFFIVLLLSFGIWGTRGGMFSSDSDSVLTVGTKSVSVNEFRLAFQREVSNLSRQFNTQLTFEQAKAFGAEGRAMATLAAGAALDQLASDMKLGLSEDRLAKIISDDPAFKDQSGVYQQNLFYDRLRTAGIRPEDFIRDSSNVAVRIQIVDATSDGFQPPKIMTEALTQYARESRGIDYIILTNANIDPVKAPGDDILAKWYEENKTRYRAPEYRKFAYVKLEPSDIADLGAVSDAAVAEDYEKHKDSYRTPETRTIEQLTFTDQAAADQAAAKLASGTTFDALVAEQGKTATDVLLGDFTRKSMPAPGMVEAAFAVKENGGITPVAQGLVGPVIMRVTNIRPEIVKPLEDVKDTIRKEIANGLASEEIQNVYDRFEDLRASGASLEETAKQLKLKSMIVDAIDDAGKDMSDAEVTGLPASAKLVAEVFKTDPGVEAIPLSVGDAGYVWFETLTVTQSRDRKLEEVKEKVVADWTEQQQKTELAKKSAELVAQVKGGAKLADIAAGMALAVETKSGIRRQIQDPILSSAAISAVFGGPIGHVAAAAGADSRDQILLQVTEVNPEATSEVLDNNDARIEALAKSSGDDILDQMMSALQAKYGVTTNPTLAERAMVR